MASTTFTSRRRIIPSFILGSLPRHPLPSFQMTRVIQKLLRSTLGRCVSSSRTAAVSIRSLLASTRRRTLLRRDRWRLIFPGQIPTHLSRAIFIRSLYQRPDQSGLRISAMPLANRTVRQNISLRCRMGGKLLGQAIKRSLSRLAPMSFRSWIKERRLRMV